MKKAYRAYILFLCAFLWATCMTACGVKESAETKPPVLEESTLPSESEIADESAVPVETEPSETDPFFEVRKSDEKWLAYGLAAYEENRESADLSEFFSKTANMSYLTLYDHWFVYDKEAVIPAAEALFRFIYENHGADALLDKEKRIQYKSEYLRSLGLDMDYLQQPEVEHFFANMKFSSTETYPYIMSFDNVTYHFKDFGEGSPSLYNAYLYNNTAALHKMIAYLKDNGLDENLNTERDFKYYMILDVGSHSQTKYATGDIIINDGASTLHEAMHAMGIYDLSNIWLGEGICDYFGKILCFNDQATSSVMQIMRNAAAGAYDEREAAGDIAAAYWKKAYSRYTSEGGLLTNLSSFDMRLYTDCLAALDGEGVYFETIGEVYEKINGRYEGTGGELTYNQAASFVAYLADAYGIKEVMRAYRTQDIEEVFGKNYEELKKEWILYLE